MDMPTTETPFPRWTNIPAPLMPATVNPHLKTIGLFPGSGTGLRTGRTEIARKGIGGYALKGSWGPVEGQVDGAGQELECFPHMPASCHILWEVFPALHYIFLMYHVSIYSSHTHGHGVIIY